MLLITLRMMEKQISLRRLFCSSLLGGGISVLLIIFFMQHRLLYMTMAAVSGMLLLFVAMKQKSASDVITGTFYFYMMAYTFTGFFKWIFRLLHQVQMDGKGIIASITAISVMSVISGWLIYTGRRKKGNTVYRVSIVEQGKQIEMNALFDTGNALREPFSGKPVSIVEKNMLEEIWDKEAAEKYRYIPFRSIGKEHGMLNGLEVDEMIIHKGEKSVVLHQAVLALYEGKLSSDGSFQMILHQGLL